EARTALVTSSLTMSSAASARQARPHSCSTARACSRAHGVAPGRAPSGKDDDKGQVSEIPGGSVTGSAQVTTLPSPIVRGAPLSPSSLPGHCLVGGENRWLRRSYDCHIGDIQAKRHADERRNTRRTAASGAETTVQLAHLLVQFRYWALHGQAGRAVAGPQGAPPGG